MKHLKSVCYITMLVVILMLGMLAGSQTTKAKTVSIKGGDDRKIQRNLNQLKKKGGTLILRKGNYRIRKTITVYSNTTIRAKGKVKLTSVNKKSIVSLKSAKRVRIQGIKFSNFQKGTAITLMQSKDVKVQNCTFDGGSTAIGSGGVVTKKGKVIWQSNFAVQECSFRNITYCAIRGTAWKNVKILDNHIYQSNHKRNTANGILLKGVSSVKIGGNKIGSCTYPIAFRTISYKCKVKHRTKKHILKNSLSRYQKNLLASNLVNQCSHLYAVYDNGSESRLAYYYDKKVKTLTVSPGQRPYLNMFTNLASYRGNTQDYYMFKACMVQLEKAGGGTLYVNPGEYHISNAICVPSNVSIVFREGATLKKTTAIYKTSLDNPKTMFILVAPSLANRKAVIGGYNGTHNVHFIGNTKVVMDCAFKSPGRAIDMGHCYNISIRNIEFKNEFESHLIELNSSKNVSIDQCKFHGFRYNDVKMFNKELINIDGSDASSCGFNHIWSNGDKTTCNQITIQNCQFSGGGTGVGTHSYAAVGKKQCYHTNVKILNNSFYEMRYAGVLALNWKNAQICNNTFTRIGAQKIKTLPPDYGTKYYGMYLQGIVHPTICGNTFNLCRMPFVIVSLTSMQEGDEKTDKAAGKVKKEQGVLYADTKSDISGQTFLNNTLKQCRLNYYRVDSTSNSKSKTSENYYFSEPLKNN